MTEEEYYQQYQQQLEEEMTMWNEQCREGGHPLQGESCHCGYRKADGIERAIERVKKIKTR